MNSITRRRRLALSCFLVVASHASAFTCLDTHKSVVTRHHLVPLDHATIVTDLVSQATAQSTFHLIADVAGIDGQKDLGWWGSYINFFKSTLNTVHRIVDSPLRSVGIDQTWGISIAIFTISIRSLLIPLSIQQSQNAEYMKALKPYISEIKEKFKDNQDAQNRALGKLYEDADQNPLSGCLTSLAQVPIFLGLYRGIRLLALDGALDEKFLWIPSLEGPVSPPNYNGLDWLTSGWTSTGGLPTPALGWETTLGFLVMPVVLVLLQTTTMNALQPAMDDDASEEEKQQMESTQGVLKFLPLLIGFFSLQVPAGLTIYWLSSNLFTLTQSLAVKAYFAANPPKIELPEYWEQMNEGKKFDEMTPEERRQATEAGLRVGPSFEELVNESRFHVLVERQPFRETTDSWKRVTQTENVGIQISAALEEWVSSGGNANSDTVNGKNHSSKQHQNLGQAEKSFAELEPDTSKKLASVNETSPVV